MRLDLVVDDVPFRMTLERDGDIVRLEVDGHEAEAKVERLGPTRFEVTLEKSTIEVDVDSPSSALIDGHRHVFRVLAFDASEAAGGGAGADGVLRPPMPGAIAKLLVKEGQRVAKGTPMAVLEAMKMQNEIVAPFDAVVRKLHVKPGDAVTVSDVIAELDAEAT